jgi:hypothetical protein
MVSANNRCGLKILLLVFACMMVVAEIGCKSKPACRSLDNYVYSPGCSGRPVWIGVSEFSQTRLALIISDERKYYWSDNKGRTWNRTTEDELFPLGYTDEGPHPKDRDIRYRADDESGAVSQTGAKYLERTSDGGRTWKRMRANLEGTNVQLIPRKIYYDPEEFNRIYVRPVQRVSKDKSESICLSTDGGNTFKPIFLMDGYLFSLSQSNVNILYAADLAANVYRSSDRGVSWRIVLNGPTTREIVIKNSIREGRIRNQADISGIKAVCLSVSPKDPDVVYFATDIGLIRSTDGGRSWCGVYIEGLAGAIGNILFDPEDSTLIFLGTQCGLFRSNDNGNNWKSVSISEGFIKSLKAFFGI